jgi:hypothetical protein
MATERETYDNDTYEYKRVYHRVRYFDMNESKDPDHLFHYIQRKRKGYSYASKWSEFKPFCSCGWKADKWFTHKSRAMDVHYVHAEQYPIDNPRLL